MKHLKSIYRLLEKQLKLFIDDDKPDDLKQIGLKYLKTRKSNHNKKGDITNWEDAKSYLNDNLNKKILQIIENDFDELEYNFHYLKYELEDFLLKNFNNKLKDDLEKWDDIKTWYDAVDYLDSYSIDLEDYDLIKKFGFYLIKNNNIEMIIDTDYYYNILYWIEGGMTKDKTDNRYVYRYMMLPYKLDDIEEIVEDGVGIFWSYTPDGAESHDATHIKNEIILKASVEPNDVN